jgi:GDSL-like Lipase/Acylhydrolase family
MRTPSSQLMSMKRIFANTGLVLASTALTALLLWAAGEGVLRWRYGALPTRVEMGTFDEGRGWKLQPGHYTYFDVMAVRRVDISINELGLRNPPLTPEPRPGVERVTILGDSFIFGAAVDERSTISARLQALAGPSYEVINAGVPGYGTGQEYLLLEDLRSKGYYLGSKLVLAFFTNDLQDNLGLHYSSLARRPTQPAFSVDAAGNLQHSPVQSPRAGAQDKSESWVDRSLFLQFLRYQVEVLLVSYPRIYSVVEAMGLMPSLPRTPGIVSGWYGPEWEDMWKVSEDVIEHVVRKLRATGGGPEIFIAFAPSPFQVHESFRRTIAAGAQSDARYANFLSDPDRPQRVLEALAQRLDVPFIDLTPSMRRAAEHSAVYFPREGHFNELGCDIAAQVIYEHALRKAN